MASEMLIKAVIATAEVMGTELTESGAEMMCQDLSEYTEQSVLEALGRCRREVNGKLTLADVVSRIDDGRPGVEEAWAMIPRSESETIVWTEEMAAAFDPARRLLQAGDEVAARMAFKETYNRLVTESRTQSLPVYWTASLGQDPVGRESVIRQAVEKGRLKAEHASKLLPNGTFEQFPETPRLGGEWHISGLLKNESKKKSA